MSQTARELDLKLKLRVMRYLWRMGYFVRRNVELVQYAEGRREYEQTDVDVLGISFDTKFKKSLIVCDCRTGRTSNPERIFRLAGIAKYFGTQDAILVRDFISETKYFDLCKKLAINAISQDQLDELENSVGIAKDLFYGSFCEDQSKSDGLFDSLRRFDKNIYEYIAVQNWEDPPHLRILTLIGFFDRLKDMKGFTDSAKSFMIFNTLSILSLAFIEFAKDVLSIKSGEKELFIKEGLIGGRLSYHERKELLSTFYDFMVSEIHQRYSQKYPVPKKAFMESVIPSYAKYFVDLILRLCQDPEASIEAPRIIDLFAYEKVLNGRKMNLDLLYPNMSNQQITRILKPIKDIYTFMQRTDLSDKNIDSIFNSGIQEIESEQ